MHGTVLRAEASGHMFFLFPPALNQRRTTAVTQRRMLPGRAMPCRLITLRAVPTADEKSRQGLRHTWTSRTLHTSVPAGAT